eukprot:g50036.t1
MGENRQINAKNGKTGWQRYFCIAVPQEDTNFVNTSLTSLLDHAQHIETITLTRRGARGDTTDYNYRIRVIKSETGTKILKQEFENIHLKINSRGAWKKDMKKATRPQALNVWTQTMQIPYWKIRDRVKLIVKKNLGYKHTEVMKNSNYILKANYTSVIAKRTMRLVPNIITQSLETDEHVTKNLLYLSKVVVCNTPSISKVLVNSHKWLHSFSYKTLQLPTCSKQCKGHTHFAARLADMPGVLGRIGELNALTIHYLSRADSLRHLWRMQPQKQKRKTEN